MPDAQLPSGSKPNSLVSDSAIPPVSSATSAVSASSAVVAGSQSLMADASTGTAGVTLDSGVASQINSEGSSSFVAKPPFVVSHPTDSSVSASGSAGLTSSAIPQPSSGGTSPLTPGVYKAPHYVVYTDRKYTVASLDLRT